MPMRTAAIAAGYRASGLVLRLIAVAHALKISDRCCQKLPLKVLGRGGPQCWQSVYACESPYAQRRPPVKIGSCRSRRYPLMTASPETGRGAFA